jgi:hypothetical protein
MAFRKSRFPVVRTGFDPEQTIDRLDLYRKIAYARAENFGAESTVRRPEFTAVLEGAATWPLAACAQQPAKLAQIARERDSKAQ